MCICVCLSLSRFCSLKTSRYVRATLSVSNVNENAATITDCREFVYNSKASSSCIFMVTENAVCRQYHVSQQKQKLLYYNSVLCKALELNAVFHFELNDARCGFGSVCYYRTRQQVLDGISSIVPQPYFKHIYMVFPSHSFDALLHIHRYVSTFVKFPIFKFDSKIGDRPKLWRAKKKCTTTIHIVPKNRLK